MPSDLPGDPPADAALPPAQAPSGHHTTLETLADVTLAPVQELRHSPRWLRLAMAAHLLSTFATGLVALYIDLGDWLVYLAMGVATNILAGNFMRWRRNAGLLRRTILTLLALATTGIWGNLLIDRAVSPLIGTAAGATPWFWVPVALLVAASVLLLAHLITSLRHDRRIPLRQSVDPQG
ncbi:MAG: hypothetical protein HY902_15195 [Deltaproteobacteria bacterium]|nr:hypothetical protein [Deltaproteobacteria bacterium]